MVYNIGIFGATGKVGTELIKVLYHRKYPIKNLRLFASEKSAGNVIDTPGGEIKVENADNADFRGIDIAFFAISGEWSKKFAKKAVKENCTVIDNSSAFRYDKNVPLVIPEINSHTIKDHKLIANPNCTTAIAILPLNVIYKNFGIKKIIMSSYQAASGAGAKGMEELENSTRDYLNGNPVMPKAFQHSIAFNLIPQIDIFMENGYTKEEMKVVWETRKILECEKIDISATCVRIPTFRAHAMAVTVETEQEIDLDDYRNLLNEAAGINLVDNPQKSLYPMPITSTGIYNVEVGRIRHSNIFGKNGVDFFVCGDQLLKGAALNAVQIAEALL